jgi:hypothetical protein
MTGNGTLTNQTQMQADAGASVSVGRDQVLVDKYPYL